MTHPHHMPPRTVSVSPRMARQSATRGVLVLATVALGACRGLQPMIAPSPAVASAVSATGGSAWPASANASSATPVDLTTPEAMRRVVASVFGDSLADGPAIGPGDGDVALIEPVWDIDVRSYETHERVEYYVQLFSGSSRTRFAERLSRGTRYEPMIRAKLKASGMPEDLTYLALIESGYDPHAYSRAAAVGMWQFMSATARGVGLRVDWWMDERRDPARATDGAIRFLGDLQKQFGSLYLAAAAYNGGPGRVARGLTRFASEMEGTEGEDRFFALAEQNYLHAETKNYVPQLIAAALVAKMPARYGITLDSLPVYAYDSILAVPGTTIASVGRAGDVSASVLRDLNPALLRGLTPPDAAVWLRLPVGIAERTAIALDGMPEHERLGYHTKKVVGPSQTPTRFASSHDVTLKQLRWFNPSLRTTKKGRLVSGQMVRVPTRDALNYVREIPDPSIEHYGGGTATTLRANGLHVVKKGESIGMIAKRYRTTVSRLQSLNGMRSTRVLAGQTLKVRSSASSTSAKVVTAKKATAKKATAKKTPAKKVTAKKTAVKKAAPAKGTASSAKN